MGSGGMRPAMSSGLPLGVCGHCPEGEVLFPNPILSLGGQACHCQCTPWGAVLLLPTACWTLVLAASLSDSVLFPSLCPPTPSPMPTGCPLGACCAQISALLVLCMCPAHTRASWICPFHPQSLDSLHLSICPLLLLVPELWVSEGPCSLGSLVTSEGPTGCPQSTTLLPHMSWPISSSSASWGPIKAAGREFPAHLPGRGTEARLRCGRV